MVWLLMAGSQSELIGCIIPLIEALNPCTVFEPSHLARDHFICILVQAYMYNVSLIN